MWIAQIPMPHNVSKRTKKDDVPMKSKAQRAFLHVNKPEIAKKFEAKTPKGKKLPKKVKRGK